jgi:hypothetical protein
MWSKQHVMLSAERFHCAGQPCTPPDHYCSRAERRLLRAASENKACEYARGCLYQAAGEKAPTAYRFTLRLSTEPTTLRTLRRAR